MAKVFTITEGLENLGALKTGGQGSVYKGRRTGEIITAIKLLPTPIHGEDENDKNYRSFQNEVKKLQKVNEAPHPNVVTILGSGITETGCLPFIEMEFIDGPDLGELLKPPHDPVFTINEVVKVANHLSHALAHCHKCNVKHGDIKSNNVKYNQNTGNYMLLDFGLAVMSDEDRRTSLRHAGAIEFMAPEQNGGEILFETDVYSFGVIIYELLAGTVPFPLHDSGETARNAVMVSHMETPPPELMELRYANVPESWDEEKFEREMQVPEWLLTMTYKCLEKKPGDRFANGMELYDYVTKHSNTSQPANIVTTPPDDRIKKMQREKEELKQQLALYQKAAKENEEKLRELRSLVLQNEKESMNIPVNLGATNAGNSQGSPVSKGAFYTLLVVAVILAGLSIYSLIIRPMGNSAVSSQVLTDTTDTAAGQIVSTTEDLSQSKTGKKTERKITDEINRKNDSITKAQQAASEPKSVPPASQASDSTSTDSTSHPSPENVPGQQPE